ncbi:hypothetical protein BpHYR1_014932 [Brachionus plicatilis]|uniref:Uncharacterized protein n=1 Tax=Brachionus plicatilis TaxID=10195 RepID=A0A3M7SCM5_BRAPC|nr:hypothetical protein BpHYR1_014932 [Brachionus plicatilis]
MAPHHSLAKYAQRNLRHQPQRFVNARVCQVKKLFVRQQHQVLLHTLAQLRIDPRLHISVHAHVQNKRVDSVDYAIDARKNQLCQHISNLHSAEHGSVQIEQRQHQVNQGAQTNVVGLGARDGVARLAFSFEQNLIEQLPSARHSALSAELSNKLASGLIFMSAVYRVAITSLLIESSCLICCMRSGVVDELFELIDLVLFGVGLQLQKYVGPFVHEHNLCYVLAVVQLFHVGEEFVKGSAHLQPLEIGLGEDEVAGVAGGQLNEEASGPTGQLDCLRVEHLAYGLAAVEHDHGAAKDFDGERVAVVLAQSGQTQMNRLFFEIEIVAEKEPAWHQRRHRALLVLPLAFLLSFSMLP